MTDRQKGRDGGAEAREILRPVEHVGHAMAAPISAVKHAIEVLNTLSAADRPLGVNEIARNVGVHKSTVSRILSTLEGYRLVERNEASGRFQLGIGLVALAGPLLGNLDIVKVARPALEAMARESGETVSLSVWDGKEAVSVEQALGASAIKHFAPPGRRNPGHCTATGKAFLAHLPPEGLAEVLGRGLERYTRHTITDPEALVRELEKVRARGYAINEEEFVLEVCAVAAVVHDRRDEIAGVIAITVPKYRFTSRHRNSLADLILRNAAELSRRLGNANARN